MLFFSKSRGQDPCLKPHTRTSAPIRIGLKHSKFRTKDSGFKPSTFLSLISPICTASLFFPLSAAFLPQGFCTEKVFNEVCYCSVYRPVCHVGHVGQFLFQPHATASRLRGCVRVTWTSIRGMCNHVIYLLLSSCTYTQSEPGMYLSRHKNTIENQAVGLPTLSWDVNVDNSTCLCVYV